MTQSHIHKVGFCLTMLWVILDFYGVVKAARRVHIVKVRQMPADIYPAREEILVGLNPSSRALLPHRVERCTLSLLVASCRLLSLLVPCPLCLTRCSNFIWQVDRAIRVRAPTKSSMLFRFTQKARQRLRSKVLTKPRLTSLSTANE